MKNDRTHPCPYPFPFQVAIATPPGSGYYPSSIRVRSQAGWLSTFFKIILKCQWQGKNAALPFSRICMLRSAGRGRRMWMTSFPLFRLLELHLGVGVRGASGRRKQGMRWEGGEQEGEYSSSTLMSHPPSFAQLRTRRMVLQGRKCIRFSANH